MILIDMKKYMSVICGALWMCLGAPAAWAQESAALETSALTKFTGNNPIISVIKEHRPEDYKRLILPLEMKAKEGALTDKDLAETLSGLKRILGEKILTANADQIRALNTVGHAQYLALREQNPTLCSAVMNGQTVTKDSFRLSKDIDALEQATLASLFTDAPRDPNFVPDIKRGGQLVEKIVIEVAQTVGISNLQPEDLGTAESRLEHQKVCDFGMLYFTKQSDLSDEDLMHLTVFFQNQIRAQ